MSISRLSFCFMLIVLTVAFIGCKSKDADKNQPAPSVKSTGDAKTSQDIPAGLAELNAEDRLLAEKQRICPVSGDILGGMGKPYKTSVNGKTVFLCCSGCEQELKDNPDKYLAKLKDAHE